MNFLEMARNIARNTGTHVFTTAEGLVDNTNRDAQHMSQAIQETGARLRKKDWIELNREELLTVSAGSATNSLPADFDAMWLDTQWDRTTSRKLNGPVQPAVWQALKSGFNTGIRTTIRLQFFSGTQYLMLDPAPTTAAGSGPIFAYEYRSDQWVQQVGGTLTGSISIDTDSPVLDPDMFQAEVEWRFLRNIGRPFAAKKTEAERETRKAFARNGGMTAFQAGPPQTRSFLAVTKDTSIGLST
jgi:hypothetical protein